MRRIYHDRESGWVEVDDSGDDGCDRLLDDEDLWRQYQEAVALVERLRRQIGRAARPVIVP